MFHVEPDSRESGRASRPPSAPVCPWWRCTPRRTACARTESVRPSRKAALPSGRTQLRDLPWTPLIQSASHCRHGKPGESAHRTRQKTTACERRPGARSCVPDGRGLWITSFGRCSGCGEAASCSRCSSCTGRVGDPTQNLRKARVRLTDVTGRPPAGMGACRGARARPCRVAAPRAFHVERRPQDRFVGRHVGPGRTELLAHPDAAKGVRGGPGESWRSP
jgi:hypothetical protein